MICTHPIMSSSNNQSISVSGMLKNMLDQGFTTLNCLSELIDDSQGAHASIIRIDLKENGKFTISDNGYGMNREEMKSSHCFHRRSKASNIHGRFGIGRKQALVNLTQLKHNVQTISQSADGSDISQMDLDFPTAIQKDVLELHPHDLSVKTLPFWEEYAIDAESHGTITHFQADKDVMNDLLQMAESDQIQQNLSYSLGVIYHDYLVDGGQIELIVNGNDRPIFPIDILCWDQIEEDKLEVKLSVYINPINMKEVRAYYVDPFIRAKKTKGKLGYREHSKAAFKTETPPKEFTHLGAVMVRVGYAEDWPELHVHTLNKIIPGIYIPKVGEDGRQAFIAALGGREVKRNKKIIAHFPPTKMNAGTTAHFRFYEQTYMTASFNAVNEEKLPEDDMSLTMDNPFRVGINKSRLEEDLISKPLWDTISKIKRDFGTTLIKKYIPESDESDSDQSISSASSAESVPKRKKPQIVDPVVPPVNVILPGSIPASLPISPQIQPSIPSVCIEPVHMEPVHVEPVRVEPTIIPDPSNQTQVGAHTRHPPKSERDILIAAYQLATECTNEEWEELIEQASIETVSGLIDDFRAIHRVRTMIQNMKLNQ